MSKEVKLSRDQKKWLKQGVTNTLHGVQALTV